MINYRNELNENQYEACTYTDGPLLILAGAGSGKTRVLTYKIAYMIGEKHISPSQILAITFTNKAAGEMLTRAKALLENTDNQISPTICTFHSFGYQILRRTFPYLGFTKQIHICDDEDMKKRFKKLGKAYELDKDQLSMITSMIGKAKDHLMTPDDCYNAPGEVVTEIFGLGNNSPVYIMACKIYAEYQAGLLIDNLVDFDDLIMLPAKLFKEHPDILSFYQDKFRYILVDEYQDTSHAQFVLTDLLAQKYRNLCVVGDDYQSIYYFRGADITNILSFKEHYPDAKIITLGENYRSTQTIVNSAANVIANNKHQFEKDLRSMNEVGDPIRIKEFDSDRDEAEYIAKNIEYAYQKGEPLSSFAILYRQNNLSRVLEKSMFNHHLPVTIFGGVGFYQRAEIKDIISYLSVIGDSGDSIALQRIINRPARGIGKTAISKIETYSAQHKISFYDACMNHDTKNKKIEEFKSMIFTFRDRIQSEGLSLEVTASKLLELIGYYDYLKSLDSPDDEMALKNKADNLDQLLTQCHEYDESMKDASFSDKLDKMLEDVALMTDQDLNKSDGTVSMMSMHRSKGLEYKYVFIAGCEDEIFPGADECELAENWDLDANPILEEERRLCYVAMTRAKKYLYITNARCRYVYGQLKSRTPSRFIYEISAVHDTKEAQPKAVSLPQKNLLEASDQR